MERRNRRKAYRVGDGWEKEISNGLIERVRNRVVATGAIAVMGVFAIAGCESNTSAHGAPSTARDTETTAPTGAAPSTPAASPSSIETNNGSGVTIEQMKSMPFEEFNALDRGDQLRLFSSQLKEMDGFIGDSLTSSDPTLKNENPLNVASIDNTGDEILKQWEYSIQTALYQSDSTDLKSIDKVAAKKMLAGSCYYTTLNAKTAAYCADLITAINSASSVMVTNKAPIAKSTSEVRTGIDRKGNPIKYRDILATSQETGKDEYFRFVYVEYRDFNGRDRGIWLAQQIELSSDKLVDRF